MNENEIDRIAAMANALRPDWPTGSLRSLLQRPDLVNRSRRDVAVALAWVACDSKTKTPARVIEAGPWWQATNAESGGVALRPPKREEACEVCGLRADFHGKPPIDDHGFVPLRPRAAGESPDWQAINEDRREASPHLARLRAELQSTRSRLCPCGVDPARCSDHKPEPDEETTDA